MHDFKGSQVSTSWGCGNAVVGHVVLSVCNPDNDWNDIGHIVIQVHHLVFGCLDATETKKIIF